MSDQPVSIPPDVRTPRDVLADRIETWAEGEDWHVYYYADRLLADLDRAGWELVPTICLADGCEEGLETRCPAHGRVVYGVDRARMERVT